MATGCKFLSLTDSEELAGRDVIEYLRHGFNLYDELLRNSFTDDVALAELAVIRCEEFVCGLSLFYHAVPWPEGRGRFSYVSRSH